METFRVEGKASWRVPGGMFRNDTEHTSVGSGNVTYQHETHSASSAKLTRLKPGSSFEDALIAASKLTLPGEPERAWRMVPVVVLQGTDGSFAVTRGAGSMSATEPTWTPPLPTRTEINNKNITVHHKLTGAELVRVESPNPAVKGVVYHNGYFDLRDGPVGALSGADLIGASGS